MYLWHFNFIFVTLIGTYILLAIAVLLNGGLRLYLHGWRFHLFTIAVWIISCSCFVGAEEKEGGGGDPNPPDNPDGTNTVKVIRLMPSNSGGYKPLSIIITD